MQDKPEYKEPNIDKKLLQPYNPADTEDRIYQQWQDSGFFNPDVCIEKGVTKPDAPHFSIVLPPPNVTGTLHLGHAFEDTMQDVLVRYNRMKGKKTLWIPGTDHAAIATQSKVEKILEKEEGKRKTDLGREEFLKRVDKFAQESHDTIVSQIKKMGASIDWSREAFTLDEKRNFAVRTAFKKMYDEGLIYRGYRIVNWDPKGQTVISDDEVVYEERKAKLYTFKYSKDFPISISTTRPETKVGDMAVAVNPADERYTQYVGQTFEVADFCGVPLSIKIIADHNVEKDFGTGALGVTPAHSQIDWEMAQKNNLEVKPVINEYAKMTVGGENLLGKKTGEAREIVAQWLRENDLMESEVEVDQNVSTAERTGAIIEPIPKLQWFINVNKPIERHNGKTLKDLMLEPVVDGKIKVLPDRFEKIYSHWIANLRDWCISRQIWYGHRVPVWYRGDEVYCDMEAPEGEGWEQDSDSLDTWFSSGLWTFSTLGWPDMNSADLKNYHPTTIVMPGYEILPFWVARMVLMSQYLLNEVPFDTVYFHGIVRDSKGKKFSKSANNGIDPIDVINEYGTDALRMALVVGVGPGNDTKFDMQKVKAYKHFANKLWNIARFTLSSTEGVVCDPKFDAYTDSEKTLIEERDNLISEITKEMDEYKFYLVGEKLYAYAWTRFADVIIEESKPILNGKDENAKMASAQFLLNTLEKITTVLHPFMPFVTEELWSIIHKDTGLLMVEKWPTINNG
ncbi:MAG: valine--tRNA ligase [Candidatus Pacebacteria bacterium]|nr:valine--tRNA ligase [Candidatus Paceibacterota bacterium]MBP9715784.1 valine--tRNA ligase [Candidatus Paceibacterota bacterium]